MKRRILFVFILFAILFCSINNRSYAQTIYFNDSGPTIMILGNSYWEIGLKKNNGGIKYITDKSTGQQITQGNLNDCLWVVVFEYGTNPDYFESCQFWDTGANRFSYQWSEGTHKLVLTYTPSVTLTKKVSATITITAHEFEYFDIQMTMINGWGRTTEDIKFPSDLIFQKSNIESALLPVMPGIMLESDYFKQNDQNVEFRYPGWPGIFSDFLSVSTNLGSLAIYSKFSDGKLDPLKIGFVNENCGSNLFTCYTHNYTSKVRNGEIWTSPAIRIRITQNHIQAVNGFRIDNLIDLSPSLEVKTGDIFGNLIRSPLYKADSTQIRNNNGPLRFSEYSQLLNQITFTGLLHIVAYEPRGFDENYPDFLPPATDLGTTQEMADMFTMAQTRGFLMMPYTNPTWWDDESPTLQNLNPAYEITDVAALDGLGNPVYENYGCPDHCHYGYAMSPYVEFVQTRLRDLMIQMKTEIPSDIIFEDQVGARPTLFDYNPQSPSPEAYTQGWINHAEIYSGEGLMTELGFDRLIENEIGFHGSLLLQEVTNDLGTYIASDNWHYYPYVTMLARDKVVFYQHNLAPETFTHNKSNLMWNLAMGYMLSYDLNHSEPWGGGVDSEWLDVVGTFQRYVLSKYATERVTDFSYLNENVTKTNFSNYYVIANWSDTNTYSIDGYTLSVKGAMVKNNNNSLIAGVFRMYNNNNLSNGDHFIIEERQSDQIKLRQPMGEETNLVIKKLPSWGTTKKVKAIAFTSGNLFIDFVDLVNSTNTVQLRFAKQVNGVEVGYYLLYIPKNTFMPIIYRN